MGPIQIAENGSGALLRALSQLLRTSGQGSQNLVRLSKVAKHPHSFNIDTFSELWPRVLRTLVPTSQNSGPYFSEVASRLLRSLRFWGPPAVNNANYSGGLGKSMQT